MKYTYAIVVIDTETGSTVHHEFYKRNGQTVQFNTNFGAAFSAGCALTGFLQEFKKYDTAKYSARVHVYHGDVHEITFNWR